MNDAPGDNKEAAVQLPQRYLLQFNIFFLFLFIYLFSLHVNSDDISLSSCFLLLPFYLVPCSFRVIFCKPILVINLSLHTSWLIAEQFGPGGTVYSKGTALPQERTTWKDTCQPAPKSLQSSSYQHCLIR